MDFTQFIRTIPDYPKPGIMFRDITTLISHPEGLSAAIDALAQHFSNKKIDVVAGIEARGFIIGGAIAQALGTGFIPVRKQGKLPWKTLGEDYQLEYGTDRLEIHEDAIEPGARVLMIDDLIATGGTAIAAISLINRAGGSVVGAGFLVDLPDLGGAGKLTAKDIPVHVLCAYEGE